MFIVGNCSSQRQVRWVDCIVPNAAAADFPAQGFLGGSFYQKAGSRPCGTTFHVLADVPGDTVLRFDGKPVAAVLTPAISRLCPDPASLRLELQVDNDRALFVVTRTEGIGTHRVRFHMRATLKGFVAELWADVRSFQDLIDVCGRVTWTDQTDPNQWSSVPGERVRIHIQQGNWQIDYATRWGIDTGGFGITSLTGSSYPDAMSMPFYGHWTPAYPLSPPAGDPFAVFWEQRRGTATAAREGPLTALWHDQEGNWFATGSIPVKATGAPDAKAEWERFKRRLNQPGNLMEAREFASPLNTGQTGDTQGFGFTKDYLLLRSQDPRRIYQLRESTVDYLLRCHHHAEKNGEPVTYEQHPGLMTWNLATFRTGTDLLGKATETPGDGFAFGRPFVDDEHRADLFIAAVRHVTDDPLLEADLKDRTEMDKARAFRKNKWVAAPRASGRLFQSWAMAWWTTWDEKIRKDIHTLSVDEFALRSTQLQTNTGLVDRKTLGPIRPANVIGTDLRVIDGGPAWVPWNDACLLTGLWHQIALWDGPGNDKPLAAAMRAYWIEVAETILKYGTVRAADGLLYPLSGVLWRPGGEVNSDAYYTFPRAGASFGDDAWDMAVGTHGWFSTLGWPTVVTGYLKIGENADIVAIAKEIHDRHLSEPNVKAAEWMVA